jgi:tetratricopeptide (TPR) repeat protein
MNPNERLVSKLRQKQKELGLTDDDTGLQESPTLMNANAPRQEDLEFYEQMFGEMAQRQYPLHESDRRELEYFQQVFHLSDEDVFDIEQRVLGDIGRPPNYDDMEFQPQSPAFPVAPSPLGATVPPQDYYSGEGSTTPTQRNRPASANRAAVQNAAMQNIMSRMGNQQVGQSAAQFAPAPLRSHPAEPPLPVDLSQSPPVVNSEMTPAETPVTPAESAAPVGSVTEVSPVATPPTSAKAETVVQVAQEPVPPPQRRWFLERRVLLPFAFLSLFLLTAGLVAWAMLRLYALPTPTVDPQQANQLVTQGAQKTQKGELQAALQDFDRAIQLNPNDVNAHINRGYARHRDGNLSGAVDDYRRAIELSPNSAQARSNLSHVRFDQGNYKEAENEATRAIELKNDLPEARINLGNALFAQGDLDRASQEFQAALDLPASNPTKARAHNNRGNIFLARDQIQDAGQQYDQAISFDPTYADAFFNRAIAHERNQNFQAALQDFTDAAKLYRSQGNDRRGREAQAKADQMQQALGTTPPPPTSPNSNRQEI